MSSERKVAIVTGAGRGIGAAIAGRLSADGYAVAVNYVVDRSSADQVVHALRQRGGEAHSFQADVSREADVVELFRAVEMRLGGVTVLVNNGGVTGGFSRVENLAYEALMRVFAVNVVGAFLCCREAVRRMSIRQGGCGGSIINISSRAGDLGGSGEWVHYAATKGALDTLTRGLAKEVALEGIRVNAIAAGLIETDLHAAAGSPDRTERLAPTIPMGRAGLPNEVAECASWLVSPAAAYVTGAVVPVSGGR